jgi:hypothetical protein
MHLTSTELYLNSSIYNRIILKIPCLTSFRTYFRRIPQPNIAIATGQIGIFLLFGKRSSEDSILHIVPINRLPNSTICISNCGIFLRSQKISQRVLACPFALRMWDDAVKRGAESALGVKL